MTWLVAWTVAFGALFGGEPPHTGLAAQVSTQEPTQVLAHAPARRGVITQTPPRDEWVALDKWKHFVASAVLQSVAYGIALERNSHADAIGIGASVSLAVGLGREVYDGRVKARFSRRDLVWDLLGTGAAALVLHTLR